MRAPCDQLGDTKASNPNVIAAVEDHRATLPRRASYHAALSTRGGCSACAVRRPEHRHAGGIDRFDDEYITYTEPVERPLVRSHCDLRFGVGTDREDLAEAFAREHGYPPATQVVGRERKIVGPDRRWHETVH